MGRGTRESLFLLPIVPHLIAILLLLLFLLGYPAGASVAQTAQTKHTKVLWLAMLWWIVLFTAIESVELFILFTDTNATHKYLNRFFSLAERQISPSKNSCLFQIHEMCLNKLIIIKIFCGHNNLMPVETRSAFASTSFYLFLSLFLHFLSEQHVFICTCCS